MKQYSTTELISASNNVPQVVQDAVNSDQTAGIVADIGLRHGLHIDQIGHLADLTTQMLLGLTSPPDAIIFLGEIGVQGEQARSIFDDINKLIFVPLQQKLRESGVAPKPSAPKAPNSGVQYGRQAQASSAQGAAFPTSSNVPQVPSYQPAQEVSAAPSYPAPASAPQPFAPRAAAPQPAPAYRAPAPLPPRSVMPGGASKAIYAPALPKPAVEQPVPQTAEPTPRADSGFSQPPVIARAQTNPAPMPSQAHASVAAPVAAPAPPISAPSYGYAPAQEETPRQSEPPAPPPNLPGIYGSAPSFAPYGRAPQQFAQPALEPVAAPFVPPQSEPERAQELPFQPQYSATPVPAALAPDLPYVPQRASAQPVAPQAPRRSLNLMEQPLTSASASSDPYREPLE